MILLDIDGVMADFLGPMQTQYAIPLTGKLVEDWTRVDVALKTNYPPAQFWASLPLLPWAKDLLKLCQEFDAVTFCTAISEPGALLGRAQWLRKHFPNIDVIYTTQKHLIQGTLIDDHAPNIKRHPWDAILFPSTYNTISEDPISYVRKELIKIYGKA